MVDGTNAKQIQPHQQRVIDEKTELDAKRDRLRDFKKSDLFKTLPKDEQARLDRQTSHMAAYSNVLGERIAAF